MTANATSCIIHSETPCQEQVQSAKNATGVRSGDANRLVEEHQGVGEAVWVAGGVEGVTSHRFLRVGSALNTPVDNVRVTTGRNNTVRWMILHRESGVPVTKRPFCG